MRYREASTSTVAPTIYVFGRQYGDFAARVPALPGCGAVGATKDEAVARARERIAEYLSTAPDTAGRFAALKSIDPARYPVDDTIDGAFLPGDPGSPSRSEAVDAAALFAAWSAEIARLTAGSAREATEARSGAEWSVREIRDHLAATQVQWLSRLDAITDGSFRVHDALDAMVRERIAALETSTATDRDVLGGRWSARRVVRRLMEHQYEHLVQIRDTLRSLVQR